MTTLQALEARLREDLLATAYPDVDWVRPLNGPDDRPVLDCAIVGAGQMGMTIAAGLRRERVDRTVLFDQAEAGREGPWLSFARMQTLRTPKHLTGPELGIAKLGFRAWWIAQHGEPAWDDLFRIPRTAWMEYLVWYRHVMRLEVRNRHRLTALAPAGPDLLRLVFDTAEGPREALARTVVLATGSEGGGGRHVPEVIAGLPAQLRAHTNDDIDFARLRGKRIGILGAGASGFDTAIAALEAGAASVDLCFRRAALPAENPRRWMETPGFLANFPALPPARRWAYLHRLYSIGQPPPLPTFQRAVALPGFAMHPATPWDSCVEAAGGGVTVRSGARRLDFDFVIAATGIAAELGLRRELDGIRPHIALWSDRYAPPPDRAHRALAGFPWLGPHGEFTEREPGSAPFLSRIHFLGRSSTLSLGPVAASNSALKYIGPLVMRGVVRTLMLDQAEADWAEFVGRRHPEIAAPVTA